MPILSPCCFICSIDAARNVSAAAKTHEMPFLLRKSAIFAIVVVFPVPLIPANKITKGSFSLLLDFSFILSKISKGSINMSSMTSFREFLISNSPFFLAIPFQQFSLSIQRLLFQQLRMQHCFQEEAF